MRPFHLSRRTLLGAAAGACLAPWCDPLRSAWAQAAPATPLELQDGDRVAWLGSTVLEREQAAGFWELALTTAWPERNIAFRNLSWSGDTVWGEARAGFGTAEDGFRELNAIVEATAPSVLLVCYGANESFAGPAGADAFRAGLARLLDALGPRNARTTLVSPPPQEHLGPPLPDPSAHNEQLAFYRDLLLATAQERGLGWADFFAAVARRTGSASTSDRGPWTEDSLQFTPAGYQHTAPLLLESLGVSPWSWSIVLGKDGSVTADGVAVEQVARTPTSATFSALSARLPLFAGAGVAPPILRIERLRPGAYELAIDGQPVLQTTAAELAAGVPLLAGPEADQREQLRQAIVKKNELFFHRWRPQNVTYLFGFRAHEQGNNAKEVAEFDPLIAEQEQEIARLRAPVAHEFALTRIP